VLPSPNGSTLTLKTGQIPTFTGCLRHYQAVAAAAQTVGPKIAVIPAGEIWPDGRLRPALEDWLGAGAIISQLSGKVSPEARAALAAFRELASEIEPLLRQCGSGKELIERGFEDNVALASALNVSNCAPRLVNGAYIKQN
jgi:2-phosphosulfolactate phosphatase